MANYYDSFGRIHNKPVTAADPFPCNNSFLYSGEASLIGVPVDKMEVAKCWDLCQTSFGYERNPYTIGPNSSHDEVVGMFMLWDREHRPDNHFQELKGQHFQVCNLPGFKPTPLYKLNPFKAAYQLYKLSKEANARTTTQNYPYIWPICFRHRPEQTYFYSRCAGINPGIIHSLYFLLSSLHSISFADNSGSVMLGFKLLKLKKMGQLTLAEKIIKYFYNKRIKFAVEVMNYFPQNHPIAVAALSQFNGSGI